LSIVVTGSLAFDYIMSFPGCFKDHILADNINVLSVSFLVDSMCKQRGGCASNIAYNLALLGERPMVMATAGEDFCDYRRWLDEHGVDTSGILEIAGEFTSSFFVSTDRDNNQIASFYTGAMSKAGLLSFHQIAARPIELAIISPNDPAAMVKYAAECKALRIPHIYDPSQQIIRLSGEELADGARGARMLIVNEYEFEMMKKKTNLDDAGIHGLSQVTVVTEGERGSRIMELDRTFVIPAVRPQGDIEPTGVGDAYRAGLMKGMVRGFSWDTSGRMASLAATYALEQPGTQNHRYTLAQFVERYVREFGSGSEIISLLATEEGSA
jgi:adenosine kinase